MSKLYAYGLGLALLGAAGLYVWGLHAKVGLAQHKEAEAVALAKGYAAALEAERAQAKQLDADRKNYLDKLEAATNENNTLRNDVDAIRKRLSVRATCSNLPGASTDAPGAAPTVELDPAARQDYFNLRRGIVELEARYQLCLDYANLVQKKTP